MEMITLEENQRIKRVLEALSKSNFRSKFCLKENDKEYVRKKGLSIIENHAKDFVEKRLAPKLIENDGKQTPMRGHPVFIAQHATATCCRGCLYKWHKIPKNVELTNEQKEYIVDVIMTWIKRQMENQKNV